MENKNDLIIGKGVLFPIKLSQNKDGTTGWYPVKGDPDLIKHNLKTLIEYHIGQRFRQEYYGTRLWECLEEPAVPILIQLVNQFIRDSIEENETRIVFDKVNGYLQGSKIVLNIQYRLNNNLDNLSIEFRNLEDINN